MAQEGRRFRRRKKEDVFIDGYFVDHATDVAPDFDRSEETFHLYGKDDPEHDVQHNSSMVTVEVLDKQGNAAILDVLTGKDPDQNAPKQYKIDDLASGVLWANVKNPGNTQYLKSWIVGGWSPGMPLPSGGANDKARLRFTGRGDLARQFDQAWLMGKKVASGTSVAMGLTPFMVPGEDNVYAVHVRAIRDQAGKFETEDVTPTAAMVTSAGAVVFAEIASQSQMQPVTHAYVIFLQTGTTAVYPAAAAKPDKLRK